MTNIGNRCIILTKKYTATAKSVIIILTKLIFSFKIGQIGRILIMIKTAIVPEQLFSYANRRDWL